jgi:hypothetical protein
MSLFTGGRLRLAEGCPPMVFYQPFPLWVRNGFFDYFMSESCLLVREAKNFGDAFAGLGVSREETKALYRALCRDWGMEKHDE